MSPTPYAAIQDDGAMNSLLAAVEAVAATTTGTTTSPIVTSTPVTSRPTYPKQHNQTPNTSPLYPTLVPLRNLQVQISRAQSCPQPITSSVPPPPPLPPPLPVPPPLPPMAIRRSTAVPVNTVTTTSAVVTVHEASPPPSGDSKKRKGARIFSANEKKVLEANYARNKFPSRLHMQTLGRAMGKGTDKVRTWYNNRRALDRKHGIDVSRNSLDQAQSPSQFTDFPINNATEEPIILPSHVIASPTTLVPSVQVSPGKQLESNFENGAGPEPTEDDIFVNVTPSTIAWAPSESPVTTERNADLASSLPSPSQASRFRMSPLRIRNGRLRIGEIEICGELSENPATDRGLEVKFLFGKKRVVYEWYCGNNYAEAQSTGGPYAKMEMNFSTVGNMQLFKIATTSVLQLSFSAAPSLFLQTQESMDKYKVRAQQRQYRKVDVEAFPIPVCADHHRIWMGTDEAVRVSRILIEDTPQLASVFQTWQQGHTLDPNAEIETPPLATAASRTEDIVKNATATANSNATATANSSMPQARGKSPGIAHPRSLSIVEPSRGISTQTGISSMRSGEMSPPAASSERESRQPFHGGNELPIVRPTTAAGAAANLLASPALWHSPATPFVSSARPRGEETMHWLTGGVPPSVSATPLAERTNLQGTPRDTSKVRRELNFNTLNQFPTEPPTPASQSRKRNASEVTFDENEANGPRRRRLDPLPSNTSMQAPRYRVVDLPFSPHLSTPFKGETLPIQMDKSKAPDPRAVVQADGVLHTLPR